MRIAVIGSGRMGEALVRGLIRSGAQPDNLTVADPDPQRLEQVASQYNVMTSAVNAAAARAADLVILAVKPALIPAVATDIADAVDTAKPVISIAAGIPATVIEAKLKPGARVVRVMPNSPAEKGAGMAAISRGTHATDEDIASVTAIFSAVGLAVVIDESLQNAATALNGSGPAYFYLVIKALTEAGVELGLDHETAYRLAHETMFGASRMLKYAKKTPSELIEAVRSPNGTTAAALDSFSADGLEDIIKRGVKAAADRAWAIEQEVKAGEGLA